MQVIDVPLDQLVAPDGIRKKSGDLDALASSIQKLGVLVPLIVADENADMPYRIVAGRRRHAAASLAGLTSVPCIVTSSDAADVVVEAVDNLARKDLTDFEKADAFRQMTIAGLDVDAITVTTGESAKRVRAGLKAAGSETASTVAAKHDLTLEHAAAIAEFDDVPGAVARLVESARNDPARFTHVVSRLRQDRKDERAAAKLRRELEAAGITVLDERKGEKVAELADENDKPLSEAKHRKCPGHAVWIAWGYRGPEQIVLCVDPAAYGHRSRYGRRPMPGGETGPQDATDDVRVDAERQARRDVIAGNKAWRAAVDVRKEFVASVLARKAAPKGAVRFVTTAIAGNPRLPAEGAYGMDWRIPEADAALPLVLVEMVSLALERTMTEHTWRDRHGPQAASAALYFEWLGSVGYGLSEIEQRVIDQAAP